MEEISQDQYKVQHLKQRISELVADYEEKMATGAVQLQMYAQQNADLHTQVQQLQAEVARLSEPCDTAEDGEVSPD